MDVLVNLDGDPEIRENAHREQEITTLKARVKDLEYPLYPTDGWILTNIKDRSAIKVKPDKHITIDLQYKQGKWFTQEQEVRRVFVKDITIKKEKVMVQEHEENCIYRCYFNEKLKLWEPREQRVDKHKANNQVIEDELFEYHINKWTYLELNDLVKMKPYYQFEGIYQDKPDNDNSLLSRYSVYYSKPLCIQFYEK